MAGEWQEVALGEVCTKIGSGATPRGGRDVYLQNGPYSLIRSQNVHNDGFHRDGLAFIGDLHADELQNVEVFEDDVLLNITGDSVARVCQVAPDVLPARVNQHVAIRKTGLGQFATPVIYDIFSHLPKCSPRSYLGRVQVVLETPSQRE